MANKDNRIKVYFYQHTAIHPINVGKSKWLVQSGGKNYGFRPLKSARAWIKANLNWCGMPRDFAQ